MATETPSEPQSIQEAFEQAKVEHSPKEEHAQAADASTEATTAETTSQHTDTAAGATTDTASPQNDLVSDADFAAIQAQFPGDPAKQRAELNKAWTQKTQKLAQASKRYEPYAKLIEAYEHDSKGTVEALAKQHGLTLAEAKAVTETTAATSTAASIADQAMEAVKASLGPELDFLAPALGKAIHQVAEMVAKSVTEQHVKPLKEQQETLTTRAAQEQVETLLAQFSTKHPDWKTHEAAMTALSQKVRPNGMAELEYMELLYSHVTRDSQIADATQKALAKMTKAAQGAETATHAVNDTTVKVTRSSPNSIAEAYAMALRGERVED